MMKSPCLRIWPSIAILALHGCGSGAAGIVSATRGGNTNSKTLLTNPSGFGTKTSPAILRFELIDTEGDSANIGIWLPDGGPATLRGGTFIDEAGEPQSASSSLRALPASGGGTVHYKVWDFEADGYGPSAGDVLLRFDVENGNGAETLTIRVGNTIPIIGDVRLNDELTGLELLELTVIDEDQDPVQVSVEYLVANAQGCGAWKLARPGDLSCNDPTPEYQLDGPTSGDGSAMITFAWDTAFVPDNECEPAIVGCDLASKLVDVDLKIRVKEILQHPGDTPLEDELQIGSVRIDNNSDPTAILDIGLLVLNSDQRRGLGISFTLVDQESHPCGVALQWSRPGEEFLPLPQSPFELDQLLANPQQRRELRICKEYPVYFSGRIGRLPQDADPLSDLRLPSLAKEHIGLSELDLDGRGIEILRSTLGLTPQDWSASTIATPTAILPLSQSLTSIDRNGTTGLVAEDVGTGWLLWEVDLGTGAVLSTTPIAGGPGEVLSMDGVNSSSTVFALALAASGEWWVNRIDTDSGSVDVAAGSIDAGPPRELAAAGDRSAYVTAGSALWRTSFAGPSPALSPIAQELSEPWGIVLDPLSPSRALVAESGRDRILRVDLRKGWTELLAAEAKEEGTTPLPRPTVMALERDSRLFVMTQPGATGRLVYLPLNSTFNLDYSADQTPDPWVIDLENSDFPPDARLALGAEDLRVLLTPGSPPLVSGGVAARRTIAGLDPRNQIARLEEPLDFPPPPGSRWRITKNAPNRFPSSPSGASSTFVWDSTEVIGDGDVVLRAVPFDSELGNIGTSTGIKTIANHVREDIENEPIGLANGSSELTDGSLADINSDGVQDPIFSLRQAAQSSEVIALTSTADGAYVHQLEFSSLGTFVQAIDIDGDDLVDIFGSRVYYQNSAGEFDQGTQWPVSEDANTLHVIDLNRDRALDIVVHELDKIGAFLQAPARNFTPLWEWDLPGPSFSISDLADYDADGIPDLAIADGLTAQLYRGVDGAGFENTPSLDFAHGLSTAPKRVDLIDVDLDGQVDLALVPGLVLFQSNKGQFEASTDLQPEGDVAQAWLDADRNGDLDLVTSDSWHYQVNRSFLRGRQGIIVGPPPNSPLGALAWMMDGRIARMGIESRPNEYGFTDEGARFYRTPALGSLSELASSEIPLGGRAYSGDADGDTLPDVFVLSGDTVQVVRQGPPTVYVPGDFLSSIRHRGAVSLDVGDVDIDGDIDLVVAYASSMSIGLWLNDGLGNFHLAQDPISLQNPAQRLRLADLNEDGFLDLFLIQGGFADGEVGVYLSNGQPDIRFDTQIFSATANVFFLDLADMNSDGDIDFIVRDSSGRVIIYVQDEDSFGSESIEIQLETSDSSPLYSASGDFDGNGELDIAVVFFDVYWQAPCLSVFLQRAGEFSEGLRNCYGESVQSNAGGVTVADMNHDGLLDVVAIEGPGDTATSRIYVLEQVLPGAQKLKKTFRLDLADADRIIASDLEGDGDLDLLLSDSVILRVLYGAH